MGRCGLFEFVVAADRSAAAGLRVELKKWLLAVGVNGSTGYDITSAVTEAFTNAVEHPVDPTSRKVTVEGEVSGGEVVFHVRDQGRWNAAVDQTRGHYGYKLMEAQMDSVEVERSDAGTVVTLRRAIQAT